jgi:ribonuclease I
MSENKTLFENVVDWLNAGYPEGVPPKDYFPVLALLKRSLAEEDVVKAAQTVLRSTDGDTVTEADIRAAVQAVNGQEPNPEEIHQVASRLASVGWPLATPAR